MIAVFGKATDHAAARCVSLKANGYSDWFLPSISNVPSTLQTYSPSTLTATTYFRVAVTSYLTTAYSTVGKVTVYPKLKPGEVIPAAITVISGRSPDLMRATAATGGYGVYTYQWQSSSDGINSTSISGATSATYAAGVVTANIWYRLMVTSNGASTFSNSVPVSVGSNSRPQYCAGTPGFKTWCHG